MNQKEQLLKEYQVFVDGKEGLKKTFLEMKFNYKGKNKENHKFGIAEAMTFWRFVRSRSSRYLKMLFVEDFVNDKNKRIAALAQMEYLPEQVWRKILWRKNIDFPASGEAFIRRLSEEQILSIRENYEDYVAKKVPRIYKESLRDRVKLALGVITREALEETECSPDEMRYKTRNAWAYNLLGIDFGFGLYPHGDHNDEMIENKKFTRFLSVKEHVNDFSVNQEDGKYWWMYKTVRSNYVLFPNKDVKLSTHVCPGFWFTLLMHFLFWIISPVLFTSLLPKWQTLIFADDIYWRNIDFLYGVWFGSLMGVSSFTPILLLTASIKFSILQIGEAIVWFSEFCKKNIFSGPRFQKFGQFIERKFELFGDAIGSWLDENGEMLKSVWLFIKKVIRYSSIVIGLAFLSLIYYVVGLGLNEKIGLHLLIGPLFIVSSVALMVFIVKTFYDGNNPIDEYFDSFTDDDADKFSISFVVLLSSGFIAGILDVAVKIAPYALPALKIMFLALANMFMVATFVFLYVAVVMLVMSLSLYGLIWIMDEKNEEKFAKFAKFVKYGVIGYVILCVYFMYSKSGSYDGPYEFNWLLSFAVLSLIFVLPFYFFTWNINTETINDRKKASLVATKLNHVFALKSIFSRIKISSVAKKGWLKELGKEQIVPYIDLIYNFASAVFLYKTDSDYKRELIDRLLLSTNSVINTDLLNDDIVDLLRKINDKEERLAFATLMIVHGLAYGEAKNMLHAKKVKEERKEAFRKRFTNPVANFLTGIIAIVSGVFYYLVVVPFKFIFVTVLWNGICVRVWRFVVSLWDLFWFFYEEACPHIAETKDVKV